MNKNNNNTVTLNDYYRGLLDMVNCGVISYTLPDHRLLHMNAEALKIFGADNLSDVAPVVGQVVKNVQYKDSEIIEKLRNLRIEDGAIDYECVITSVWGHSADIMARSEIFVLEQGERCIVTTFIDMSESQTLKNEKGVLDALCSDYTAVYECDLANDSVIALSPTNIEAERRGEKVIGKGIHSFSFRVKYAYDNMIVKESAPDFLEKMDAQYLIEYLKTHKRFIYRLRVKPNPSGYEYFDIQVVKLSMLDGYKVVLGFHYIDDVIKEEERQRIQLENALISANQKNEIISAISTLYWQIFSIDLVADTYKEVYTNGNYTLDNPNFTGMAKEDFLEQARRSTDDAYEKKMEEFVDLDTLEERLSGRDTIYFEFKAKSGFWVSARYVVQARDDNGKLLSVLFLVQKIDEQKKMELEYQRKLEDAAKEARLANEAKTNFLRRMSHDIRTPLNGIMGLIKIDETHFDDLELIKENHKKMNISANHLLSLINDVLQMSKLEAGNLVLTHEVISLAELSRDVVNIIIGRAVESGIRWDYERGKTEIPYPYIYGSPVHLRQIFLNVYGNCIKYNKPGGKITTIVDGWSEEEGRCVYHWVISDTGIGMSEEFLKRIFEPFAQENTGVHTNYTGIGLGMAIVKGLIEQMGGTIKVTSKEGVGSTFELTIPFDIAPEPDEDNLDELLEGNSISGRRIMLVEDNELNIEIAQTLLTDEGAIITTVTDGKQAVELFDSSEAGTFDAILMDMMMPVMDGITAAKTIRALDRPDAKTIPIIAMTANAFKEDAGDCFKAGMNAHLAKPINMTEVKKVLARLCK